MTTLHAIERLAVVLEEGGRGAGTASAIAANTVRSWAATGRSPRGQLRRVVRERAAAEIAERERQRNGTLSEAARAIARVEKSGVKLSGEEQADLAGRFGHRATVAEGLLLALGTDRGRVKAVEFLGDGFAGQTRDYVETGLRAVVGTEGFLAEGMGFPVTRDAEGRFHGMHGLEKAIRGRGMVAGEGASTCAACGSTMPNAESMCPNCGAKPGDVLEKLSETATEVDERSRGPGQKGRGGGKPRDAKQAEFERLHPRTRKGAPGGGQFIQKGEGMATQEGSARVRLLQDRLAELGIAIQRDGRFGDETEAALKQFQKHYGLMDTGKVDPSTLETLRNPPPLSRAEAERELALQANPPGGGGGGKKEEDEGGEGVDLAKPDAGAKGATKVIYNGEEREVLAGEDLVPAGSRDRLEDEIVVKKDGKAFYVAADDLSPKGKAEEKPKPKGASAGAAKAKSEPKRKAPKPAASKLVRRGDGSDEPDAKVTRMQEMLKALGFDPGETDGRFGEKTESALREFQQRSGLRVDGVAGELTLAMLRRKLKRQEKERATEEASYRNVGGGTPFGVRVPYGGVVPALIGETDERPVLKLVDGEPVDEASSASLPDLPNKPGKTNWVEKAGGLPKYIERIAKHLHHEKGMTVGHAIAVAVNVVKKMCAAGDVNFPGKQNVNPGSRAEACAAVASWEAKKLQQGVMQEATLRLEREPIPMGKAGLGFAVRTIREVQAIDALPDSPEYLQEVGTFDERLHPRRRAGGRGGGQFIRVLGGGGRKGQWEVKIGSERGFFVDAGTRGEAASKAQSMAERGEFGETVRLQAVGRTGKRTPAFSTAGGEPTHSAKLDSLNPGDQIEWPKGSGKSVRVLAVREHGSGVTSVDTDGGTISRRDGKMQVLRTARGKPPPAGGRFDPPGGNAGRMVYLKRAILALPEGGVLEVKGERLVAVTRRGNKAEVGGRLYSPGAAVSKADQMARPSVHRRDMFDSDSPDYSVDRIYDAADARGNAAKPSSATGSGKASPPPAGRNQKGKPGDVTTGGFGGGPPGSQPWKDTGYSEQEYKDRLVGTRRFYEGWVKTLKDAPEGTAISPSVGGPKISLWKGAIYVEHPDDISENLREWQKGKVPKKARKVPSLERAATISAKMDIDTYMARRREERSG